VGRANLFVAALGVSGYCFCTATPAQATKDWLDATAQALRFYGGVPQLIVPDNPRALVTQADRYEPVLTETVRDFARHYGCSVLPARAYHPQDKPKVELSVLLVERWILARLRKFQFASVQEVNDAIAPLLQWLNPACLSKAPWKPCQCVCPNRRPGPDGLAGSALGVGGLQNGARAHRQPCRI
jgi:Transposase and inactivated derivatives